MEQRLSIYYKRKFREAKITLKSIAEKSGYAESTVWRTFACTQDSETVKPHIYNDIVECGRDMLEKAGLKDLIEFEPRHDEPTGYIPRDPVTQQPLTSKPIMGPIYGGFWRNRKEASK